MNHLIDYAMQFVGLPYRWGGDDSIDGFDCSGFVQELLASVQMDPPGDQTAQRLFYYFRDNGIRKEQRAGSLAFYGSSPNSVTHVGFCITNKIMIEAAGGGSRTKTKEDAARHNAYIRMRPISGRSDFVESIQPRYKLI